MRGATTTRNVLGIEPIVKDHDGILWWAADGDMMPFIAEVLLGTKPIADGVGVGGTQSLYPFYWD